MHENSGHRHQSLAGSILLAHPRLQDGNFQRTVVLMTAHSEEGAMGVVLNRPLSRRLGDLGNEFEAGPLASVPLFQGGPVEAEQLIFAAWRANVQGFQLHFGVDPEKAGELASDNATQVRAFLGFANWSAGQLENELKHHTWIVAEAPADLLTQPSDISLWRSVLVREGAEWGLLADEPDDPEQN